MPTSLQEQRSHEHISLYLKESQLSRTGEWADYLLHLNQEVVFRRDTPSVVDPEDAFSLSWVTPEELVKFFTKDGEQYDSQNPQFYWQTRLANLDKEIDRVGPDNSKLGISLLTLKGFIENQLQTVTNSSTLTATETRPRDPAIEQMFGNGLKVIELTNNTVKLSPVNPINEELLPDRATALTRLAECYQDSGMVRVPKPLSISTKQKYVEVERAPGFPLVSIDRQKQMAIHELPQVVRTRLITQLLRGIDLLNLRGYVFGDYNDSSFNFDPQENLLWITDPGLNEIRTGDFYNKLPGDEASKTEVHKMFESGAFIGLMEILGLDMMKVDRLKTLSSSKQLQSVEQVIDVVQSK